MLINTNSYQIRQHRNYIFFNAEERKGKCKGAQSFWIHILSDFDANGNYVRHSNIQNLRILETIDNVNLQ
jgi:hypothetical protein